MTYKKCISPDRLKYRDRFEIYADILKHCIQNTRYDTKLKCYRGLTKIDILDKIASTHSQTHSKLRYMIEYELIKQINVDQEIRRSGAIFRRWKDLPQTNIEFAITKKGIETFYLLQNMFDIIGVHKFELDEEYKDLSPDNLLYIPIIEPDYDALIPITEGYENILK